MKILAIDTALEACSVGIDLEGETHVWSEVIGRGHAERLFGLIEAVLADTGTTMADFGRLAVTVGPGSFTGLRIGVAAIRGFALVTGAETLGLTTLAVHAETAFAQGAKRPVLAALPAKHGNSYAQLFAPDGDPITEPAIGTVASVASLATDHDAALAGAGALAIAAEIPAGADVLHDRSAPEMLAMLRLARRAEPPFAPPRPLYLRPPDAVPASSPIARV